MTEHALHNWVPVESKNTFAASESSVLGGRRRRRLSSGHKQDSKPFGICLYGDWQKEKRKEKKRN